MLHVYIIWTNRLTLNTAPHQVVVLQLGEGGEEVSVEEPEEEEVWRDGRLADLQDPEARETGDRREEGGLLPGVPSSGLDRPYRQERWEESWEKL